MILLSDLRVDDFVIREDTSKVMRVEAKEIAMDGELLSLAITFDNNVDRTLWAGEWCKSEIDDRSSTIFFADPISFIKWRGWTREFRSGLHKDNIVDLGFLERGQRWQSDGLS